MGSGPPFSEAFPNSPLCWERGRLWAPAQHGLEVSSQGVKNWLMKRGFRTPCRPNFRPPPILFRNRRSTNHSSFCLPLRKCGSGNLGDEPRCFPHLKMEAALCHTLTTGVGTQWGHCTPHRGHSEPSPGSAWPGRPLHTSVCRALRPVRSRDGGSFCLSVKGSPARCRRQREELATSLPWL